MPDTHNFTRMHSGAWIRAAQGRYLEPPTDESNDSVDWDEQDHHCHTSKHRRAHGLVEEVNGKHYLQWGRPEVVEVTSNVHHALCVDGHQVDNLASCAVMTCLITQHQRLKRWREERAVGREGDMKTALQLPV